jgi:hypothetical protein
MFRTLAAWHTALLYLLSAAVWAELDVGVVPPLAIFRYSFAMAKYWPSSAEVSGGIPLTARMSVGVTLVRPCCSNAVFACAYAWARAACAWAVVTAMPAWRASSSLIWYRISQVKVDCVCWDAVRFTTPGYCLTAWLRLATWIPRVATEIRWSPTIAAAPILTGVTAQPVTSSPTPTTMADALTSLRSTAGPFSRSAY